MRRILTRCPSCGNEMRVSELSCTVCDTSVQGSFSGCTFCQLSDENLRFVELFVACRGNIKEMERETGLGYWTIRGRLDEIIKLMRLNPARDAAPPPQDITRRRRAILEAVERGDLSLQDADRALADLAGH